MWKNISFAFKPDKPHYRAPGDTWDELPNKVYHVAPSRLRDSIDKEGLNPKGRTWNFATQSASWEGDQYTDEDSRSKGFTYRPEGVYVAPKATIHEVHAALESKAKEPMDIYEIDTSSLRKCKDHPTDVIRDPEVFSHHEPEYTGMTEEEHWKSQGDPEWGGEDDWRSWAFETVHPDHMKRVKPYSIKPAHKWDDNDYEDYMDDHPEEYQEESA